MLLIIAFDHGLEDLALHDLFALGIVQLAMHTVLTHLQEVLKALLALSLLLVLLALFLFPDPLPLQAL